jgi:hypothetical protein
VTRVDIHIDVREETRRRWKGTRRREIEDDVTGQAEGSVFGTSASACGTGLTVVRRRSSRCGRGGRNVGVTSTSGFGIATRLSESRNDSKTRKSRVASRVGPARESWVTASAPPEAQEPNVTRAGAKTCNDQTVESLVSAIARF